MNGAATEAASDMVTHHPIFARHYPAMGKAIERGGDMAGT